jgi:hypothetical protein
MYQRLQQTASWIRGRAKKLDLLLEYSKAVYRAVVVYVWEEILVAPIMLWWLFGHPPMWLVAGAFLWAFLIASYGAWREERRKNLSDEFRCWIYGVAAVWIQEPARRFRRVYIGIRLSNVGPPASIHTWQAGYHTREGKRFALAHGLLFDGEPADLPDNIKGANLKEDRRMLASGETREGWIAFNMGDGEAIESLFDGISLGFTDAFDKFHNVIPLRPRGEG